MIKLNNEERRMMEWGVIKAVAFIFFIIALVFAFWGGYPEGIFNKVDRIEKIFNSEIQTQNKQIEILRTQMSQLSLKKWHR